MANGLVIAASFDWASLGDSLFLIVTFLLLLLLVKHFAWEPVTKMMADRQKKISSDLDGAAKSRTQAEKMAAKRQAELKNTKAEAIQIVNQARENGEKNRQEIVTSAQKQATDLKTKAQDKAKQTRNDALNSARKDVAQIAVDIAESLIKKDLNADDQEALIDDYIKGLTHTNETR